jgi:hypothetical protein
MDTGGRKWGSPYLNREFFEILHDRMADKCLLILAMDDGRPIAGALNMIGSDTLYGRYWGRSVERPFLHFEVCYYQAIDFAIERRNAGVDALPAIREAAIIRFRPIIMTTLAAILGAVPIAIGAGAGAELRQPLGIAIVGGLLLSQLLTLYTTPVVYLYFDRLRLWTLRRRAAATLPPAVS